MNIRVGLTCSHCGYPLHPSAGGWICTHSGCTPLKMPGNLRIRGPTVKALSLDPWQLFN